MRKIAYHRGNFSDFFVRRTTSKCASFGFRATVEGTREGESTHINEPERNSAAVDLAVNISSIFPDK